VSVLFADLVGFTSLSEQLDAEDVVAVQDAYFDEVRRTIERHGGLLEKFVGDAAMAVFGAPRVRDDDAERAVRAALALVAAVERLGASLGLDDGVLRLRVGVCSGEVVYGEATAERGPVTGDTVNVAARLQAAAAPGSVVVGELTAFAVADVAELEPLAPLDLKGKAQPVAAFRVAAVHDERSRERALGSLRAPTLGREELLARLEDAVGAATPLVLLVAPPGVGKTRVLDDLARRVEARATLFRCRLRPDVLSPFEPVGQLVRSVTSPDELDARLATLGAGRAEVVAAALRTVVAPVAAGSGDDADDRDRLFAAWAAGLGALAGGAAVWLVEDVHWASPDFRDFLRAAPPATTVVTTARPVLLEDAPEWCAAADAVELPPLPPADAQALVRALVGAAIPSDLVERIADASGGNPLFVEELLRTWAGAGVLVREDERWVLTVAAGEVALPPTVQAIYAGQLDDLPPGVRTAARRASVAGRRFPFAALDPLGVADGVETVGALGRRGFVDGPLDDATLGETYAYRHALLRDAGYASLARRDRAELHLRFADWLASADEHVLPSLAEVIARHYAAALDAVPALARDVAGRTREEVAASAAAWFDTASAVAASFAAWQNAHALAERAVALTAPGDTASRARRLEQLGVTAADAVGIAAAEPVLRESLDAYREAGDRGGLASAAAALGHLLRAQTRFDEAVALAEEVLAEAGGGDDASVARLLLLRGRAELNARDAYAEAQRDGARALAIASGAGDEALELEARDLLAQAAAEDGEEDEEAWATIERLARRLGRWATAVGAIRIRASFLVDDDPQGALAVAAEAAELARAHGLVEAAAWCDYLRAEAQFATGEWDDALDAGLRAIGVGETHDLHRVVVRSWFVLLPLAVARGRGDLVEQAFARFDARRGREPDSPYARVVATAAHLRFADAGLESHELPDLDSRLPSFALAHGGPSWLTSVETLVAAWLRAGDTAAAARALDTMRERLARGNASRLAQATEALLRGRLLLATGDTAAAADAAGRALALTSAPWWRLGALGVLEAAGAASPAQLAEAQAIRARLGVEALGPS